MNLRVLILLSFTVLVQYLRVKGMKREWWIDLPELFSIQMGGSVFQFKDDDSTELVMRSKHDEMKWWLDLPKLTILTALGESSTFENPRSITLEGVSYCSILTNRHTRRFYCISLHIKGFRKEEKGPYEEFPCLPSLIPRRQSPSLTVSIISCFFYSQTHDQQTQSTQ